MVLAVGVVGTVGFGYLALRGIHYGAVWNALRTSNYWWTLPSLAVLFASVGAKALRWQILFRADRRPPLRPLTESLLLGLFFNCILPARGGEVARMLDLHRRAGASRAETSGTIVVERAFDVLGLLLMLFVLLPWLPHIGWLRAAGALAAVLAVGVAALGAALARYGERPLVVIISPLRLVGLAPDRIAAAAEALGRGLAGVRHLSIAAAGFGWTIVSWVVAGISAWLLMPAFGLHLSIAAGMLVVIATTVAAVIPSLPSSLGVFEAATVVSLRAYHVPDAKALSYALVLHAVGIFPFLLIGPAVLGLSPRTRIDAAGRVYPTASE